MKNTNNDLVSIIMPNYNGARYIGQAIESVITQTYENWELLITDDASIDNSVKTIKKYQEQDNRIILLNHKKRLNVAKARNTALEYASGRYIAFLDSDDYWDKEKLEKQINFMRRNDTAFSCTDYMIVNRFDKLIGKYRVSKDKLEYNDILKTNSIGCLTVIIDKNKIPSIKMCEQANVREDMGCWLKILKNGVFAEVYHDYLATYRMHNSSSFNKIKMVGYQWSLYRNVENLCFFKSLYYLFSWLCRGIKKYNSIRLTESL